MMQVETVDLFAWLKLQQCDDISEADLYLIIQHLDSNNDGKLSLAEFVKMVTPTKDWTTWHNSYRQKQLIGDYKNATTTIGHKMLHQIQKVIKAEIKCHLQVEELKKELVNQSDFQLLSLFRAIDKYAHCSVNVDNLRMWMIGLNDDPKD